MLNIIPELTLAPWVGTLVSEIKIMIDLAVGLVSGYYLNLFVVITRCCMGLVVVAGV